MTTMELPFDFFMKPKSAAFLLNRKINANIFFFMGVAYFNGLFISELMCLLDSKRSRRFSLRYSLFLFSIKCRLCMMRLLYYGQIGGFPMKPENQGELIIRLKFEIVQTWNLASLISCLFQTEGGLWRQNVMLKEKVSVEAW